MKRNLIMMLLPLALLATTEADAFDKATINQGEYLARAGDCIACHTIPGGAPFAGGLAIDSPFGKIYSTNITPSKTAGIGNYTLAQFDAALRHGERADGSNLYPAMPYPDYAMLTADDVKALYAYFMEGVAAVDQKAPATALSFPFNQRWGISFWNWMFANDKTYQPQASKSDDFNRGAYLVQGLGHCGSCHSPRGVAFQEKSYDESDASFLSGGKVGIWQAPSLRGGDKGALASWSKAELIDYLANGRNDTTAVAGEMTSVIAHSLSYLSQADLAAIADYLKSLPGEGKALPMTAAATKKTSDELNSAKVGINSGARLYLDSCGACHFTQGQGAARVFPKLDGNALVNDEDPSGLIHVVLAGARLPSTKGAPEALAMPAFGWRLNDDEVAQLLTFVRHAWNNQAPAVTAEEVAKVRQTIPQSVMNATRP